MDIRGRDTLLVFVSLCAFASSVTALQVPGHGCKNQTIPIPLTNHTDGKVTNETTYNCSDTDGQVKPHEKKLNATKSSPTTDSLSLDSDSRVEDGINELGGTNTNLGEMGGSIGIDSLEDDEKEEGTLGPTNGAPKPADPGDPLIGEGNLLCPVNWVCSMKGDNRTMSKPSGIVMKAIPYIGLTSLAVMVLMAVSATICMSRSKAGSGETFGMKQLQRRSDNLDGCSSVGGDTNTVTVNMLALNNNPKDPGITTTPGDLTRLSTFHDYSLPDLVTNEGIDKRISRTVQGESLYMELSDLQSHMADEDDDLGSTSLLIGNIPNPSGANRKSFHIYYQPVPILPDLQQDLEQELPNVEQLVLNPALPNPMSNIPVPSDLPQASDYYPIHIPGFQVPEATLPEIDLYSDMPPHCSVYEVNDTTNKRRSLMPPMDGMSSTTTSIAGGSVYTLQGPILDGDMIRDADAEALYEQIEDRDRRSWVTSSSDSSSSSSNASHHSTLAPLLTLVPSRESLGMGPVMFANVAAHQRENYDKIDRTKRAYNKPREMELPGQDYNTLVMWP